MNGIETAAEEADFFAQIILLCLNRNLAEAIFFVNIRALLEIILEKWENFFTK